MSSPNVLKSPHNRIWYRIAIPAAVGVASSTIGYAIGTRSPSATGILSLSGLLLASIIWGPFAISLTMVLAATIPSLVSVGIQAVGFLDRNVTPFGSLVLFLVFIVVLMLLFERTRSVLDVLQRCWGIKYVAILLLLQVALTPFYQNKMMHIESLRWQFLIPIVSVIVAVMPSKVDVARLARFQLLAVFCAILLAYAYFMITGQAGLLKVQPVTYSGISSTRIYGVVGPANECAGMLLALLPLGLAALHRLRWGIVWECLVLVFCTYLLVYFQTRAAWLGYPVVLAVYFWGGWVRKLRYLGLGLLIFVIAITIVLAPFISARMSEIPATGGFSAEAKSSIGNRLMGNILVMRFILTDLRSILVGEGSGSWVRIAAQIGLPESFDSAHNFWANQFVDGGLLAVVLWLLFFGSYFLGALRQMRPLSSADRLWPVAGVASMIGLSVWGMDANFQLYGGPVLVVLVSLLTWSSSASVDLSKQCEEQYAAFA